MLIWYLRRQGTIFLALVWAVNDLRKKGKRERCCAKKYLQECYREWRSYMQICRLTWCSQRHTCRVQKETEPPSCTRKLTRVNLFVITKFPYPIRARLTCLDKPFDYIHSLPMMKLQQTSHPVLEGRTKDSEMLSTK